MKPPVHILLPAVKKILAISWGRYSLVSLYLSLASGIVLALQYSVAEPFYSTTTIELIIPFGSFWRSLHYFSSQLFFLFLLVHAATVIIRNTIHLPASGWIRINSTLVVGLLLLFTGYILRGDATGESAGVIGEHITLSIPILGKMLNALLFDISGAAIRKVYVHHLITLVLVGAYCCWPHLRRYGWTWANRWGVIVLTLLLSVMISAPMEPDHPGLIHIAGPWFFLGLQELLRFLHPFWAGIVFPLSLLLAIFLLPVSGRRRSLLLGYISLWLCLYLLLSWSSYSRI